MDGEGWPKPWVSVTDEVSASALLAELEREMPAGHVLRGETLRVLARSKAADDVLFGLAEGARVAEVHLTWRVENDPTWPWTVVFPDLATWRAQVPEWD